MEDFLDGGPPPPPPPPANAPVNEPNLFNNVPPPPPRSSSLNFFKNVPAAQQPFSYITSGIGNDLFVSQGLCNCTGCAIREGKTKTQTEADNFLYELPDDMLDLELGDGLLDTLGAEAEDLFDPRAPPTKKEEEDEILKDLMDDYDIEDIKNTMDKTGQIPESIYFFYGGESETFVNALEFIGLSSINREFGVF